MTDALIGLGSNLGGPQENLARAVASLRATPGIENVVVSQPLKTSPIGGPVGQEEFLNAAARLSTTLAPLELLDVLLRIETQLGRKREVHWGPRTLDLDLLLYGDEIISTPRLTLPHPRLATRKFALAPASEVAAEMRHPQIGWTMGELLEHVTNAPPIFFVLGTDRELVRQIASTAAKATGGQLTTMPVEVAANTGACIEFPSTAVERIVIDCRAKRDDTGVAQSAKPKLTAIVGDGVTIAMNGPTLRLPAEPAAAASELIAAIQSMQA